MVTVVKVLTMMVVTLQAQVTLYKAVIQTVLLYESDIWVVMGEMLKVLEGFDHQVSRQIAVKTARCTVDRDCEWPPL